MRLRLRYRLLPARPPAAVLVSQHTSLRRAIFIVLSLQSVVAVIRYTISHSLLEVSTELSGLASPPASQRCGYSWFGLAAAALHNTDTFDEAFAALNSHNIIWPQGPSIHYGESDYPT